MKGQIIFTMSSGDSDMTSAFSENNPAVGNSRGTDELSPESNPTYAGMLKTKRVLAGSIPLLIFFNDTRELYLI